jgi:chromosomal replication initiation ATPase DnaA
MGGDTKEGKKRYRDFVLSGISKELKNPLTEARAEAVLGTDSFIEWVRKTFIDGREWKRKEQPQVRSIRGSIPVREIARVVGEEYGVRVEELMKARSPHREARRVLIEMSYRLNMSGRPLQALGRELGGIGGDAVAHTHERMGKRMGKDRRLSKRVV